MERVARLRPTNDRLLMKQAASLLATDLSPGELFERLTTMLAQYIDSSVVFIALGRPDGRVLIEYFYDHGEIKRYPHIEIADKGSRTFEVMRTGEIIWGNRPEVWAPTGSSPIHADRPWTNDTVSAIFVPMRAAGETIGVLSVQSINEGAYNDDDVEMIAALGHYVGVAVQNQRMYQALQKTAEFDPLTGLSNHSRMSRDIDAALAQSSSTHPILAVMLNIVNFDMFNATYGHAEGDEVLRRIADTLREFEDADDNISVARFGGDVFMVLLRDTSTDLIPHFVERLSNKLSELYYVARDLTLPVSIACGYAVGPSDGGTRADLIAVCVHRTRLSRKQGCRAVGEDEIDSYQVHGSYVGIETIVDALVERDPFTRVHVLQVNTMAKLWAEFNLDLDRSSFAKLLQGALLHDAGKLLISDKILVKPGRLTQQEFDAAMLHAAYGEHILQQHPGYEDVARIVGQHHERYDGNGYPLGLKGEEIDPIARAISILDAFSAMIQDRPYHRGVSENAALAELQRCAGTQFDPHLVDKFVIWREEGNPPPL